MQDGPRVFLDDLEQCIKLPLAGDDLPVGIGELPLAQGAAASFHDPHQPDEPGRAELSEDGEELFRHGEPREVSGEERMTNDE